MKELTLCYKTDSVSPIIGIDSVEDGKAIVIETIGDINDINNLTL